MSRKRIQTVYEAIAVGSGLQAALVAFFLHNDFLIPEILTFHPAVMEMTTPLLMNCFAAGSAVTATVATVLAIRCRYAPQKASPNPATSIPRPDDNPGRTTQRDG